MTDFPRTKTSWSELKAWNDANFESTKDLEHFKDTQTIVKFNENGAYSHFLTLWEVLKTYWSL